MLKPSFFARMGMLVVERFLDEDACARLCREMQGSNRSATTIGEHSQEVVDDDSRSAQWANVSRRTSAWILDRLLELKPRLERHFGMELEDCQRPQFLVYRVGDFYVAHADAGSRTKSPDYVRERRVSVVVFLNSSAADDADSYEGGALTFSRLISDPRLRASVYPLLGEAGLLIAFRSDVVHRVTPILRGERYTIAAWFV